MSEREEQFSKCILAVLDEYIETLGELEAKNVAIPSTVVLSTLYVL